MHITIRGKLQIVLGCIFMISMIFVFLGNGSPEYKRADARLHNHVQFSGAIVSLNRSGNHAYGIIGIKVLSTNTNECCDTIKGYLFPYRLSGEYAEFYGYVPNVAEVGDSIVLDSDKKVMDIYANDSLIAKTDVGLSSEESNIKFVSRHSRFNK
jgi:hypothetical protein